MSELKHCPFCGDHAQIKKDESMYISGSTIESYTVYCISQECDTEISYYTEDLAISKWNKRPHENKIKANAIIDTADKVMSELDATRQDEWHQEMINRAIALRDLK